MATGTTAPPTANKGSEVNYLTEAIGTILKTKSGKGLSPANIELFQKTVRKYAEAAGLDVSGYRVPGCEISKMLGYIRDEKLLNNAMFPSGQYKTPGQIEEVAASLVAGFAEKAVNVDDREKIHARSAIQAKLKDELAHVSENGQSADYDMKKFQERSAKLAGMKDPMFDGRFGVANGAARVVIGGLSILGLVKTLKAAFRPKPVTTADGQKIGEKGPGFLQMVGNLFLAGTIAWAGYNMAWQGKGLQQSISDTRTWVERVASPPKTFAGARIPGT